MQENQVEAIFRCASSEASHRSLQLKVHKIILNKVKNPDGSRPDILESRPWEFITRANTRDLNGELVSDVSKPNVLRTLYQRTAAKNYERERSMGRNPILYIQRPLYHNPNIGEQLQRCVEKDDERVLIYQSDASRMLYQA